MADTDASVLDQLDLTQHSTVIWDGPTHHMSSLSNAVIYVVESIADTQAMDPLVAIGETPFLLEIEQINYIYENRLSAGEDTPSIEPP